MTVCEFVNDTLLTLMPAKQSATNGHVTLLKQKMLTAILRRLDAVLFDKLTAGMGRQGFFMSVIGCAASPKHGLHWGCLLCMASGLYHHIIDCRASSLCRPEIA